MLDLLKFIFSSFWIYGGLLLVLILILVMIPRLKVTWGDVTISWHRCLNRLLGKNEEDPS